MERERDGMIQLPVSVETALARLQSAGIEAFVVGGAVRDALRGAAPKDWDLAVQAPPQAVVDVFRSYQLIQTGLKHGTVTVLIDHLPLEITSYRANDGEPFLLQTDLSHRDFTINAMAYHPSTGLVDPCGGARDLANGVIRCVGDPRQRFQEDGLRILRARRFASVFQMQLHPATAQALMQNRQLLSTVAQERIRSELTLLLCGAGAETILLSMPQVLAVALPQLLPMVGFQQHNIHHDKDVWAHTADVVAAIPPQPMLRWAALLHDAGKPACFFMGQDGQGHFYGHGQRSADMADDILRQLRFDNASRERIVHLIRRHNYPIQPVPRPVKRLLNLLGEDGLRHLLALHRADTMGQSALCADRIAQYDQVEKVLDQLLPQNACFSLRDLALDGNDLLRLGFQGRQIGQILAACLSAVTDETIPNQRQALLSFAQSIIPTSSKTEFFSKMLDLSSRRLL